MALSVKTAVANEPERAIDYALWHLPRLRRAISSKSRGEQEEEEKGTMAVYVYELAYTSESLAAQVKNPQDRLEVAAKPVVEAIGGRILAGGYTFGEYDVVVVYEAPDDVSAAALAVAVGAGGAVKAARTTKLLDGQQWVEALQKAQGVASVYRPAR